MYLKRHYKKPEGWVKKVDEKGDCINVPPIDYLEIKHTGTTPEQNFSQDLVGSGIAEGWMSIKHGQLTLHGKPEDLVYTIKRGPGRYSLADGKKLPDDEKGVQARVYMTEHYPAHQREYECLNHFECVLNEDQQSRMGAKAKEVARG